MPASDTTGRLHALDACRAAAMLLGIYVHAALPYRPEVGESWPVDDTNAPWMAASVEVLHAFRMQLFFLLAGFFAALVAEKRGLGGLARDRGVRVGVPYLAGIVILGPLCAAAWAWAAGDLGLLSLRRLVGEVGGAWHLWFLRELLVLYGVALVGAVVVPRAAWTRLAPRVGAALLHPLGPLLLALLVLPTLLVQPWWGVHGPGDAPRWENLLHYGVFFALGATLHPVRARLVELGRHWALWASIGLGVAAPAHFAARHALEAAGGWDLAGLAQEPLLAGLAARGSYALLVASLVIGFLGVFLRWFGRASPALRYVSDASYWAYLVHFPLVILGTRVLAGTRLPAAVEVGILLAVVCPLLLGSYALFVRRTAIGRVLHGAR